jgi:RNA polymerase sigma-70 factor (ECF subfamily)
MTDDEREKMLAQGLRDGRPEAWRTLYDAFAERVWRSVARLMGPGNPNLADVVQDTFIAAAKSARQFDDHRGSLWHWLWGIARRHLALHFRKQSQRDRLQAAVQLMGNATHRDPHEAAEQAEFVRAVLAELPPEHCDALTARYLDDASVEQMATDERSTEAAIRSRLARARQSFRSRWEERMAIPIRPTGGSK